MLNVEWVEFNLPIGPVYDRDDQPSDDCLEKRGLRRPGVLIDVVGHGLRLIGNVNDQLGVCDCCVMLDRHDIVKRYAVLINLPESV